MESGEREGRELLTTRNAPLVFTLGCSQRCYSVGYEYTVITEARGQQIFIKNSGSHMKILGTKQVT